LQSRRVETRITVSVLRAAEGWNESSRRVNLQRISPTTLALLQHSRRDRAFERADRL
jgi:hypothetical protein